jgi:hypothetical protein
MLLRKGLGIVRAGVTLATLCAILISSAAAQSACGDNPKQVPVEAEESLKGDVEGKAQVLTRLLGQAQMKGAIETGRKELYERHQNLDQHQIDMYFMWVACQEIMSDKSLPTREKVRLWNDIRPTFTQRMTPAKREQGMKIPDPDSVEVSELQQVGWQGQHSVGLHKCSIEGAIILCLFVITNLEGSTRDYDTTTIIGQGPRLVDNFHVEHRPFRSYYLNGRGLHQDKINLATGDKVWFAVEFENGSKDITKARILSVGAQFNGRVE